MEINIFNVENKDKGVYSGKSFSFDPESILGPNFKLEIENRAEKVNEMIEEIDKYYFMYAVRHKLDEISSTHGDILLCSAILAHTFATFLAMLSFQSL